MKNLTIADRIVLHLSKYELLSDDEFNATWDITQDGIAASLRISRAHSSLELKKLKEKERIYERQSHFKGARVKRRSYLLTGEGMEYAKHLKKAAEKDGIDIMPMLDMKRCDPGKLRESVGEEDFDVLGLVSVIRRPIPRADLPGTDGPVLPSDTHGMTVLSDIAKKNIISVADEERRKKWHSAAADYWLDHCDMRERLYHLVNSGRSKDACRLIVNEKERLLNGIDKDLVNILGKLSDIPCKHITDVLPVKITVSLLSGDLKAAELLIAVLSERDKELGLLYSADLEMRKGNHKKALEIVNSIERTDDLEVNLRAASALGHLGRTKEAIAILMRMKEHIVTSGEVNGLDRVYMHMADISSAGNDNESAINYLTKALGVSDDTGRKKVYDMLTSLYNAIGMSAKAEECSLKAR